GIKLQKQKEPTRLLGREGILLDWIDRHHADLHLTSRYPVPLRDAAGSPVLIRLNSNGLSADVAGALRETSSAPVGTKEHIMLNAADGHYTAQVYDTDADYFDYA